MVVVMCVVFRVLEVVGVLVIENIEGGIRVEVFVIWSLYFFIFV